MSAGFQQREKTLSIMSRTPISKIHRSSAASLSFRNSVLFKMGKGGFKIPRYQNTYRLVPSNSYKREVVDKILQEVMDGTLQGVKYHPIICMKMCETISAEVRDRIFKKDYQRYKYVVLVCFIQKVGQSVQIHSGHLWDTERDTYSTHTFHAPEYVAVGLVVGLYYE